MCILEVGKRYRFLGYEDHVDFAIFKKGEIVIVTAIKKDGEIEVISANYGCNGEKRSEMLWETELEEA